MNWLLEHRLNKLAQKIGPDRVFVKRLENRLKTQSGRHLAWIPVWKLAAVPALLLTLVCGTTGAYAYTSDDVLPDHVLYPVRTGLEKIAEKASIGSQTKALVALDHLQRRLHEDRLLLSKHMHIPQARLDDFNWKLQKLEDDVARMSAARQSRFKQPLDALVAGFNAVKAENAALN